MCKVLIIEPHGDDALCSCSSILRNKNVEIDILTLAESRSSEDLHRIYPSIKNTTYRMCKDIDYGLRPKVSTYEIHNLYVDGKDAYEYYLNRTFEELWGINSMDMETLYEYSKTLEGIDFESYRFIFIPTGLVHPFHIITREFVESYLGHAYDDKIIFYGDKPYLGNRYARECLECFRKAYNLQRLELQYADREEEVKEVLKLVYPTELSMLRFSSQALLHDPDVFLASEELLTNLKEVLQEYETPIYHAI